MYFLFITRTLLLRHYGVKRRFVPFLVFCMLAYLSTAKKMMICLQMLLPQEVCYAVQKEMGS